jgi:hypothetical protein
MRIDAAGLRIPCIFRDATKETVPMIAVKTNVILVAAYLR